MKCKHLSKSSIELRITWANKHRWLKSDGELTANSTSLPLTEAKGGSSSGLFFSRGQSPVVA